MECKGCGGNAFDWFGDPWCDSCGGVMARPGTLLMRHVCTVDGKGGRLPIVWDESAGYYKFRYPDRKNPRAGDKSSIDPEFRITDVLTASGPLDLVVAMSQPVAHGGGDEFPELSVAPTSTKEEREILGIQG